MDVKSGRIEASAGDRVVVDGHRLGEAERSGEILEVVGTAGQEHFRIRWEDGHESILYPSSDVIVHRRPR
jgi:Domain of unknown function (DUF1918)